MASVMESELLVYDTLRSWSLEWPAYACCWGDEVRSTADYRIHKMYTSRDVTDARQDGGHLLVVGEMNVPHKSATRPLPRDDSLFTEAERPIKFEDGGDEELAIRKRIVHPGTVSRIVECTQYEGLVATSSTSDDFYIWDTNSQPDRGKDIRSRKNMRCSKPDVLLKGLELNLGTEPFYYAISWSFEKPHFIGGGTSDRIHLWSLDDSESKLFKSGVLSSRRSFHGHTKLLEDCCFHPEKAAVFAAVGRDRAIFLWDERTGTKPVSTIANCHSDDVNCVSWNPFCNDFLLTGSSDGTVNLVDLRRVQDSSMVCANSSLPPSAVVHTFGARGWSGQCTAVEWNPSNARFFSSCGVNGYRLSLWDIGRSADVDTREAFESCLDTEEKDYPPELVLRHWGQESVVAMATHPTDPFTYMSFSDDVSSFGGGTLQMFRVSDLLVQPALESIDKITHYLEHEKTQAEGEKEATVDTDATSNNKTTRTKTTKKQKTK